MELFNIESKLNEESPELLKKAQQYADDPHSAKIKMQYIVLNPHNLNEIKPAQIQEETSTQENDADSTNKKHTLSISENDDDRNKKFKKGDHKREEKKQIKQFKKRNFKLCSNLAKCIPCQYGDKCKHSHDLNEWFANKPEDIGTTCYVFQKYGYCPFGLTCRFNGDHVVFNKETNMYENLKRENNNDVCQIYNVLSFDLKNSLWKRKYNFDKTQKVLKTVNDFINANKDSVSNLKYNRYKGFVQKKTDLSAAAEGDKEKNDKEQPVEPLVENQAELNKEQVNPAQNGKKVGLVTDEDLIKLRPSEKKKIDWKNKTYLAPLTTVGNLPFRRICKEYGVDITCCEMAMSTNLLSGQQSEWALLKRHASEDIFGVQLAGSFADTITKSSQIINENYKVDFIDLNCGCPIDLVFDKGGGCALMTRLDHFQRIIRSLDTLVDIPVTAKIRTGLKEDVLIAHELIPHIKTWGVSMITLYGRTRQQRYSKLADWNYIDKCSKISDPIPLFGCGDILSYHDYNEHMQNTSISGCMIARGALYKPWLFTEIKEQRDWDISAGERFDMLKRFSNYGLEHWGSDAIGIETTRRFLLEWLSFLYRYIPIGILERVPQQINQRPPSFFCRNELETLMASEKCSDWIKISELLLGPAPENFQFAPKHKANAY